MRSKELFLKILDLTDEIKRALPESRDDLVNLYGQAIYEIYGHYEEIVMKMNSHMEKVKPVYFVN